MEVEKGNSCNTNKNVLFIKALIAVLIGALLVQLWVRFVNNFTFQTLKLNPDSTFWTLLIALFFTGLLVIYVIFILDEETGKQIRERITGVSFTTITANNIEQDLAASSTLMNDQ